MAKKVLYADTGMTTIAVEKTTRARICHFGAKKDTYDKILNALMDYREEHPK